MIINIENIYTKGCYLRGGGSLRRGWLLSAALFLNKTGKWGENIIF